MKYLDFYSTVLGCKENEVFDYFVGNLKSSLTVWSYFVNWEKVYKNIREMEVALNILNSLIGKSDKDFDVHFRTLLTEYPEAARVIPALAVRTNASSRRFDILVDYSARRLVYQHYRFDLAQPTSEDIERYLEFVTKVGLKSLISSRQIGSLVDYMTGVEAGLDSNARKNRVGTIMQDITEPFVADMRRIGGTEYLAQASGDAIQQKWGHTIPGSVRNYDFAVNVGGRKPVIIETNFYSGGGTKIKATVGEYRGLYRNLRGHCPFVWITDGPGWRTSLRPLREAFDEMDYIFSLDMLERGILLSFGKELVT